MPITRDLDIAISEATDTAGLAIIVPLYRNAELIPDLIASLRDASTDLAILSAKLIFINDSPDDAPLQQALDKYLPRLKVDVELLVNPSNIGFIRSCNRGLTIARAAGADALLLNSDALLTPGALVEMCAVAKLDPMIGFVSPRSNNATICNSPYPDRFRGLSPAEAGAAHDEIQVLLPRLSYVPTAVGFCLLIKWLMLEEFGYLDEIYGHGYNEENDLIMRCNRRGYRAVMANHAYVYHAGSASFLLTAQSTSERDRENRKILLDRFPEYERCVQRYFSGTEYRAQYLLGGLATEASGRRRVLFECSHIGSFFNGTFEFAIKLMREFAKRHSNHYECWVSCEHSAFRFHNLDQVEGLIYAGPLAEASRLGPFMAAIRLAQPFGLIDLLHVGLLAPITNFLILDTIAMDCQNLDTPDLASVWNRMIETTTIIGYISDFSRQQFRNRFHVPQSVTEVVMLLSTEPEEYTSEALPTTLDCEAREYILIVGNHYDHKHVRQTVTLLRESDKTVPIVVLGIELPDDASLVCYRAGELEDQFVQHLYRQARLVLFPSHYEGFGLPIMHALAHGKPVIARGIPVAYEIKAQTRYHSNLHLRATTREMVDMALTDVTWQCDTKPPNLPEQTWATVADTLERGLQEARSKLQFNDVFKRVQSMMACKALIDFPSI